VSPADRHITEPAEPTARALLDRYIAAFENADAASLERLLRRDATLEMPPSSIWFAGGEAIATTVAGLGSRGEWRMVATAANGQPAAAAYQRGTDGTYRAFGIVVLTASATGIGGLVVFGDPGPFGWFGLPLTWELEPRSVR
jgi:RNA polymerase sigma-70 factor (ECF subfamily)